jgi:spore coat polysaccharide biosynthesis protein SpsF
MRTVIFLQARLGSTRLPGKVLFTVEGKSIIATMVERLRCIHGIDDIILVTGPLARNRALVAEAKALGLTYFCGSEENLLDRYHKAILKFKPSNIIRVTADCPLIDPELIEQGMTLFKSRKYDLLTNARKHSFPHGLEYEMFSAKVLEQLWRKKRAEFKTETLFQKTFINPTHDMPTLPRIRIKDVTRRHSLAHLRWTLDYPADYKLITRLFKELHGVLDFSWKDVLRVVEKNPELSNINKKYVDRARA